ncbi:DUF2867 domain-containing protein [Nocardioides sp. CFH 31398]|uniref:DUF2867 domain-containing protein n=1 Tax=Nocardioides sp. CFH 31398 TaxID=2919579 RepID=UPI001F062167|nr:DUF2867 domain-containing protein [Nocardioides sp. CFH 31398]MCH1865086.1 DUF2867 domain-containing protein [Nocardioides sp. CFH 31398]
MTPRTSTRSTGLDADPDVAWATVADGRAGPRWYLDAIPFRFRDLLDRLAGGQDRDHPAPGGAELRTGDRAGFWLVREADRSRRRLVMEATVRAPGRVTFTTEVTPVVTGGCELTQSVRFDPAGVVGVAYLVVDLPARETLMEWVHRRTCADVLDAVAAPTRGRTPPGLR